MRLFFVYYPSASRGSANSPDENQSAEFSGGICAFQAFFVPDAGFSKVARHGIVAMAGESFTRANLLFQSL
jgi:hypothetical protein